MICEPHVTSVALTPDDSHLILACDGLWDVCSEIEAARICKTSPTPSVAAARLRDLAFALGSDDNVCNLSFFFLFPQKLILLPKKISVLVVQLATTGK